MTALRSAKKAIAAGIAAAASAAGIVIADLNWPAIVGAFIVGIVGVYLAPANVQDDA